MAFLESLLRVGGQRRSRVGGWLIGLALVALLPTSCLTPDFDFSERGIGDGGSGPQVAHCQNRIKDADEADVDCGGIDCAPCALGRDCRVDGDCVNDSCTGGRCQAPTCIDGERNGSETDVDCGGADCGPCEAGKKCAAAKDCTSDICTSGTCAAATCSDRVRNGGEVDVDCGGPCDGCEPGKNCMFAADCKAPPEEDGADVDCDEGKCSLVCPVGTGDCNRKASDGCEANLNEDLLHCGGCGDVCDPDNAVQGVCQSGVCLIDFENGGCVEGFDDCDNDPENGCEANLGTDRLHCGACGESCSDANGTASCSGGLCGISCSAGFANCDADARGNGCEVNLLTDTKNCGSCTNLCEVGSPTEAPHCVGGECGSTECPGGLGDCDGNGTCTDALTTVTNCGACGITCVAANAATVCVDTGSAHQCAIGACSSGGGSQWQDCDGNYLNGCEVDVNASLSRCGGCLAGDVNSGSGMSCTALRNDPALRIAAIACVAGGCEITSCNAGYADCDGDPTNGCEVNTTNTATSCGGCRATDPKPGTGVNCTNQWANASGACVESACQFTCNSNYLNCDGSGTNGCEVNRTNDEDNCGACGRVCGGSAQTNVASASCSGSTCSVSCTAGFCPNTSDPERKCTAPLGTTSNCSACGEVCSGGTPYCTPEGCKSHLPITVVNDGTNVVSSSTELSFSHQLQTSAAANAYRTVVLLLSDKANPNGLPPNVTYAGEPMTLAVDRFDNQAWAGIYYVLGADLPSGAGSQTVMVPGAPGNPQRWAARVIELINVNQAAPLIDAKFVSQGGSTCGTSAATLSLTTSVDAWVASVLTEARVLGEDPAPTGSNLSAFAVLTTSESTASQGRAFATGTSRNVSWVGCSAQAWSHVAAAFRPEGQSP